MDQPVLWEATDGEISKNYTTLPNGIVFTRGTNSSEISTTIIQNTKSILSIGDVAAESNVKSGTIII